MTVCKRSSAWLVVISSNELRGSYTLEARVTHRTGARPSANQAGKNPKIIRSIKQYRRGRGEALELNRLSTAGLHVTTTTPDDKIISAAQQSSQRVRNQHSGRQEAQRID